MCPQISYLFVVSFERASNCIRIRLANFPISVVVTSMSGLGGLRHEHYAGSD
jgi:hypothetical protein